MTSLIAFLSTAVLGLGVFGVGVLGFAVAPVASADQFDAKAFYGTTCASCHGPAGEGAFGPNLQSVQAKGDKFITMRITKGSPKGMPPYGEQLSAKELKALVAFVKKL